VRAEARTAVNNGGCGEESIERLAWYIVKIAMAAEGVKQVCAKTINDVYCKGQLHKFVTILSEVEKRLGLEPGELREVAERAVEYARSPGKEAKIALNQALKEAVKRLLRRIASGSCP